MVDLDARLVDSPLYPGKSGRLPDLGTVGAVHGKIKGPFLVMRLPGDETFPPMSVSHPATRMDRDITRKVRTMPPSWMNGHDASSPKFRMLRLDVVQRDGMTCQYCGDIGHQIDLKKPLSHGGKYSTANMVCCCAACLRVSNDAPYPTFADKVNYIKAARSPLPNILQKIERFPKIHRGVPNPESTWGYQEPIKQPPNRYLEKLKKHET